MFSIRSNVVRERVSLDTDTETARRSLRHHQRTLSEDGTLFLIDQLRKVDSSPRKSLWARLLRRR